jgi:hypothetical protein
LEVACAFLLFLLLSFALQKLSGRVFALKHLSSAFAFHVGQLDLTRLPFSKPFGLFNRSLFLHQLFVQEFIGLARTHEFDGLALDATRKPPAVRPDRI